ncbi:hypothetical protein A2783_05160 [Microgenomates group bacterium RIFCSPHIGHO2_01_FULL_45_11]|nr:MAG: hypothetical protein A2783_05160 [Microgenomates group bacterium RIFCSPHIGHO2_01_FULL_45_11]
MKNQPPIENLPPTTTNEQPSASQQPKKSLLPLLVSLLVVISLATAAYLFSQNQKLQSQLTQLSLSPTPSPSETLAKEETADWNIYTNTEYGYSFKYPLSWKTEALAAGAQGKEAPSNARGLNVVEMDSTKNYPDITIQGFDLEPSYLEEGTKVQVTINNIEMTKRDTKQETNLFTQTYTFRTPGGKYLEILFSYDSTLSTLQIINQILSTFKFLDSENTSPIKTSYTVPTNWSRSAVPQGPTLCLPPKWEWTGDGTNTLILNRDPGYKPNITIISNIPYSGGSKREAYFKFWENEYPNVRDLVSIQDTNINNNSVLTIYPVNVNEPKESPEGLAVVWYATGKLWKAGLSSWSMINDSQTAFLKDFYTMVSCSF